MASGFGDASVLLPNPFEEFMASTQFVLLRPETRLRRFDPFRALTSAERRQHLEAYERYLALRNGEIDLAARRLSVRERFFEELAGRDVRWRGAIDREGFQQRFLGTGTPPIDARTLWLVAIAKANEGESYGVDLELQRSLAKNDVEQDRSQLYLFLEEEYHSRILVEACRTCGLDVTLRPPNWRMRIIIHLIYSLPDRIRWVLVLCGEVLGSTVFKLLLDSCHLFAEEPAVEERLRELVGQIWQDEVLHVAFLRARLAPWALAAARRILPFIAGNLMREVPHLTELGCDAPELLRRLRGGIEIPPSIDWLEREAPVRG